VCKASHTVMRRTILVKENVRNDAQDAFLVRGP